MIIDAALLGIMLSQLIHWFAHQRSQESKLHQYAVVRLGPEAPASGGLLPNRLARPPPPPCTH
jgi:hypothetical protein